MGYAPGYFRYSFHILKTPWFEIILLASTKKKKNKTKPENRKANKKTIQPLQHFVLPVSLLCCLRENKK